MKTPILFHAEDFFYSHNNRKGGSRPRPVGLHCRSNVALTQRCGQLPCESRARLKKGSKMVNPCDTERDGIIRDISYIISLNFHADDLPEIITDRIEMYLKIARAAQDKRQHGNVPATGASTPLCACGEPAIFKLCAKHYHAALEYERSYPF